MTNFDSIVEEATARGSNGILGVVLAAVDRNGDTIYAKSAGFTSLDPSAPAITSNNVFRLASCTKLITSICALQLVSQGLLSLDDPKQISTHLPELYSQPIISLNSGDDKDANPFLYTKRTKEITLRMLLTHTSGVGYDIMPGSILHRWRDHRGEAPLAISGHVLKAFSTPLLFEPGEGMSYGGGLDWAGILIARVTGMTLGEYMRENIFGPLGLKSTTFHLDSIPDIKDRLVQVAAHTPDYTLVPFSANDAMEEESGGGGLYGSVSDYMAVLTDLIRDSPKLLSREVVELLFKPQFEEGSKALEGLKAQSFIYETMNGALTKGVEVNHSLGGLLIMEDNKYLGRTKATLSWGGSFNTLWFCNRDVGVAGMYASQMFPPGDEKSGELMRGFVEEVWKRDGERK